MSATREEYFNKLLQHKKRMAKINAIQAQAETDNSSAWYIQAWSLCTGFAYAV